ncbi:MAG TPA: hypothetical protein VJ773_10275 [Gemmatimonadales bacterium]|nr:hypothetical protein [Gemmatimonadales bacterium]
MTMTAAGEIMARGSDIATAAPAQAGIAAHGAAGWPGWSWLQGGWSGACW